jgi:hypothetical protein
MTSPIRILLQTTIPTIADDWSIDRFGCLAAMLRRPRHPDGDPVFAVTTRDREALGLPDPVLSRLDTSAFDEMWLFAVDTGDGLSEAERAAIDRFRRIGRGVLVSRDHMDLGCSVCGLEGIGNAHYFHTSNHDPDHTRHMIDDRDTPHIPGRISIPAPTETSRNSQLSARSIRCSRMPTRPPARSDFCRRIRMKAA